MVALYSFIFYSGTLKYMGVMYHFWKEWGQKHL